MELGMGIRFIDSSNFMNAKLFQLVNRLDKRLDMTLSNRLILDVGRRPSVLNPIFFPSFAYSTTSSLNYGGIPSFHICSTEDAEMTEELHANSLKLFREERCSSLQDYAKVYSQTSCYHLMDVMHNFVSFCMRNFKVSPLHCLTMSHYAWEVAFFSSGASYEYIRDSDMIKWLKSGIRAGASFSNVKHLKCESQRLGDSVDLCSHILEFDQNNQYAYACSKDLAVGSYEWMSELELEEIGENLFKFTYLIFKMMEQSGIFLK
jgi:hypothetical protein